MAGWFGGTLVLATATEESGARISKPCVTSVATMLKTATSPRLSVAGSGVIASTPARSLTEKVLVVGVVVDELPLSSPAGMKVGSVVLLSSMEMYAKTG